MNKYLEKQFITSLFPKTFGLIAFLFSDEIENVNDEEALLMPFILVVCLIYDLLLLLLLPFRCIIWLYKRIRKADRNGQTTK